MSTTATRATSVGVYIIQLTFLEPALIEPSGLERLFALLELGVRAATNV